GGHCGGGRRSIFLVYQRAGWPRILRKLEKSRDGPCRGQFPSVPAACARFSRRSDRTISINSLAISLADTEPRETPPDAPAAAFDHGTRFCVETQRPCSRSLVQLKVSPPSL